jgi:hypothetical protein
LCPEGYIDGLRRANIDSVVANEKADFPLVRKARFMFLSKARENTRPVHYFTAPPWNHAAIFIRSSSVMCVTLPNGIAFNVTAC